MRAATGGRLSPGAQGVCQTHSGVETIHPALSSAKNRRKQGQYFSKIGASRNNAGWERLASAEFGKLEFESVQ